jgi:hypothetical protein
MRAEANRGTPVEMRTIDIFLSSSADVQKERAVAEQLIRSVAAEFNLPINVSYSNPLRGSKAEDASVGRKDFGDESTPILCPRFWEYPELEGDDFPEQIPDTGRYDLVICILWSRLGTAPLHNCVMPDGSRPRSATEYEIAWALDKAKRTPGSPVLHVYRNRVTLVAPLEPKEKREHLCGQWDAVQKFCTAWEKTAGTGFREWCHDYQDLEEFENLFREHFCDFLARRLDRGTSSSKALRKVRCLESNPFRGLSFFDFEHTALYHGRTRAVGELLDALKNQAAAKKPFILVLGPSGSGKSSLVRARVLPLLIRGGTPAGNGPWRHALTRPGAGDPFDTLAAALLTKFALPELRDAASPEDWSSLASQLRGDPDGAAARFVEVLDQLTRQELDHLLDERKTEGLLAKISEGSEAVSPKSLGPVKPKMRLALVVDQLEELFTGVSSVHQQEYIAALCALANCQRVFIVATLRSDFYPHCQRFPELVKLTAFGGRCELQPPTPRGIGNMIRFPAEAAGLRFERNPETDRSLDEALLKAAIASPEPLPLLEHVLSRLYQKQLDRRDGLLRWSDYRGLGRLQDALAQHAESVFLTLKHDEQQALKFVIRHLVAGPGEEGLLNRRSVPYRDLVSSPKLDERQRADAKGLVDRLIKEGLLSADTDPRQALLISVPQEALLRRWPRLWQLLSEDRRFFQMRDRLDASLKLWLGRGRQSDDLLDPGIGLAEAETLLRDFGSSLSKSQIDYIQKSLARQKRHSRVRDYLGLAAIIVFAVFAVIAGTERFNSVDQRNQTKQEVQQGQPGKSLATNDTTALEAQRKEAEKKVELAQQNAELANRQRTALETELRTAEDKLKQVQDAELTDSERKVLQTQLKEAEQKLKQVRANSDETSSQLGALQVQLKQERDKAQKAQANADFLISQRDALQSQLKQAEEKSKQALANSGDAASQLSALQGQLKQDQEKEQKAQVNADSLIRERNALKDQLKQAEATAQLTQQRADLDGSERSALQTQLKEAEEKLKQSQASSGESANQLSALQAQLKQEQEKEQKAQANTNSLTSERNALLNQLKQAETKALLAQQNADLVSSQHSELKSRFKEAEDKLKQVQATSGESANQLSALQAQLKQEQEKEQKAQANTDFLTSDRNALLNQLKQAEERLKQAQTTSGESANQLAVLQAQLKQEQAKEQQAQANAESLTSERNVLQSQLKQAEEKAQQNADVASSQRNELETRLKKAQEDVQPTQKYINLDPSQHKSGQTQPLNPGQDSESATSPHPLDFSVLSAHP